MRTRLVIIMIISLLVMPTSYLFGANIDDDVMVTGYVVNGKAPAIIMEQNGSYGFLIFDNASTWAFIKFDRNMQLVPIRVYRVLEPKNCAVYPTSIVPYKGGFLVAGSVESGSNPSSFHWGFWLAYITKNGDILWERAYTTRFTSSISKILVDNSTGRILIVGSGSFYSGGDGFIGVFDPKNRKLEKLVAIGGLNADGIDDVLMPDDGTYIIVGDSWSLGDAQEKPFILRLTKNFSVLNSVAFTTLDGGTPVKSAEWWATYAKYSNGTIRLFGKFLVQKYGPKNITLLKSGLWWMTLDENFNPITYSFKETTINAKPIEMGYSGTLDLYHYPPTYGSMIVSEVYLNYDRFFVGWIHEGSIDGYFVNVNRPSVVYYPSFISPFTSVFTMNNSLVLMLTAIDYSDVNFKSYNPLLAIKIPFTKLHNPEELKKNFLYGGNFSIKLDNTGFRVTESRNIVPHNIKLLNVKIHPTNISIIRVNSSLDLVELRNPKPMVKVDIFHGPDSSFPSDATIYIDGTKINLSSSTTTLYLFPGKHNVTITKQGFIPHNETIDLSAFAGYSFEVDVLASFLQLSVYPKNTTIKIICPPSYRPNYRFTFNITSKIKGIILPSAYHCLVTAVKDGYVPQSREIWTFNVMNLTFNLTPESATLAISSNPPADVIVKGKSYGRTPQNLSLNPGNYTVVLSREGYQNYSANVTLKPGETKRLKVTLIPLTSSTTSSTSTFTPVAHNKTSSTTVQRTTTRPSDGKRKVCGPALLVLLSLVALVIERRGA